MVYIYIIYNIYYFPYAIMGGVVIKAKLNLSIDTDLLELAKNSSLNLSEEFEDWIRIRLMKDIEVDKKEVDFNLEKAKLIQELKLLESKEELSKSQEFKEKEELMIVDSVIKNMREFKPIKETSEEQWLKRSNGLVYIFKRKLNKVITPEQARKILEKRIKAEI